MPFAWPLDPPRTPWGLGIAVPGHGSAKESGPAAQPARGSRVAPPATQGPPAPVARAFGPGKSPAKLQSCGPHGPPGRAPPGDTEVARPRPHGALWPRPNCRRPVERPNCRRPVERSRSRRKGRRRPGGVFPPTGRCLGEQAEILLRSAPLSCCPCLHPASHPAPHRRPGRSGLRGGPSRASP